MGSSQTTIFGISGKFCFWMGTNSKGSGESLWLLGDCGKQWPSATLCWRWNSACGLPTKQQAREGCQAHNLTLGSVCVCECVWLVGGAEPEFIILKMLSTCRWKKKVQNQVSFLLCVSILHENRWGEPLLKLETLQRKPVGGKCKMWRNEKKAND